MASEEFLTISQVAELLDVDESTVRLWTRDGRLPAHRASPAPQARWRIRRDDVDALIQQRTGPPRVPGPTAAYGSRQQATAQLQASDQRWSDAMAAFGVYPERLRHLAETAEAQRKAFMYAELCDLTWTPREDARNLPLPPGLRKPDRVGPPKLWADFDRAYESFGIALAGDQLAPIAQAFADIAHAATRIADALEDLKRSQQAS